MRGGRLELRLTAVERGLADEVLRLQFAKARGVGFGELPLRFAGTGGERGIGGIDAGQHLSRTYAGACIDQTFADLAGDAEGQRLFDPRADLAGIDIVVATPRLTDAHRQHRTQRLCFRRLATAGGKQECAQTERDQKPFAPHAAPRSHKPCSKRSMCVPR